MTLKIFKWSFLFWLATYTVPAQELPRGGQWLADAEVDIHAQTWKKTLPTHDSLVELNFRFPDDFESGGLDIQIDESWLVQVGLMPQGKLVVHVPGFSPDQLIHTLVHPPNAGVRMAIRRVSPSLRQLSFWVDGVPVLDQVNLDNPVHIGAASGRMRRPDSHDGSHTLHTASIGNSRKILLASDFSIATKFRTTSGGTLFAKAPAMGDWEPNGRTLFIQDAVAVYDIGWLGAMRATGSKSLNDGQWHTLVLTQQSESATVYIDGQPAAHRANFSRPDEPDHVFKIGNTSANFPEKISAFAGQIATTQYFPQALNASSVLKWHHGQALTENPAYEWSANPEYLEALEQESSPMIALANVTKDIRLQRSWEQPLSSAPHANLINKLDSQSLARGERLYTGLCFACHGTPTQAGTLPTSRPFWSEPFKNGNDPYSLFLTIQNGFQQMPPQPWLTPSQTYDVIHYIREKFVKPYNPDQYFNPDSAYLSQLPIHMGESVMTQEQINFSKEPQYLRMDFGPVLNWTIQVAPNNIAYKGIAVRLDDGPGGIGHGRSWILYDHDTLRVAAAWTGDEFIDWKGIAFDQSHGTHSTVGGSPIYVNPVGPGWVDPASGQWDDPRMLGRDGKPYGPLPRSWVQYRGQYRYAQKVVIHYTVGGTSILESPSLPSMDLPSLQLRTFNISKSQHDLTMRVAPDSVNAWVSPESGPSLVRRDGYIYMEIPAESTPLRCNLFIGPVEDTVMHLTALATGEAMDLSQMTQGAAGLWNDTVTTQFIPGGNQKAFEADELEIPYDNPWNSWMRVGGFDFISESRAAVATWLGDVWLVDGINQVGQSLHWKRITTGLFQPLGVRHHNGNLYIACRDQIVRLHDVNGDEYIDHLECFNNDHQVTEHFHEFAMGLQVDSDGNFYYAKSARHALSALVPHHGTLLRVSPDGARTDILATGFRAANGVCLNPDGTFIVTDQEGHWNPKNRINYVREGGFYGNMFGYHDVTDSSDSAMEQPLCWITNNFDRSPGELLWVPENAAWGPFKNHLLNLSYGTGKVFLVPHEIINGQAQGGMVSLGLEFPTGIMRGRFHPSDGHLYASGMFAWAGNKHQDGGFYRIRYTGQPACLPVHLEAVKDGVHITFSDAVDVDSAEDVLNYRVSVWDLVRSSRYGSAHHHERQLKVTKAQLDESGKHLFLAMDALAPTWGMEIQIRIRSASGDVVDHVLHNTIHVLSPTHNRL